MALRAAQRIAQKLQIHDQQHAALLDRCLTGAMQARRSGADAQATGAALGGALWTRCLHGSAPLLADDGKSDLDAANQASPSGSLNVRKTEPKLTSAPAVAHAKPTPSGRLTHVDKDGRAAMVDVGKKLNTQREAVASAKVLLGPEVFQMVTSNSIAKGDVMTVAELAGIMGAKHTSLLIPLCHNISLTYVDVKLKLLEEEHAVFITAEVRTVGPTGVEMEALTAASTAALTIYDMCKAVSRRLQISQVVLESKHGGKSGTYIRGGADKPGP